MTVDKAHRQTDKQLEKMEQHLRSIYSRAAKELSEKWADYLKEINKEIKSAEDVYEAAKKSGNQADIKKAGKKLADVKREKIMMNTHYQNLTEDTAKALANVNQTALDYINGELPSVYTSHYNAVGSGIESQVNGYSFELTDANTVRKLATENKSLLPAKRLDIPVDMRWNTQKINAEILQGILLGDSMDKIAGRMRKVTNMNATSAIRNARTMVTGAENAGRMDMLRQAEADGLRVQKEWIATNDSRTRHWHADLDGELRDIDKPFENDFGAIMFPADPSAHPANVYNCRCTLGYKVLGLGKNFSKTGIGEDIREFTDAEKNALEWYVSGEGMFVNQYLRGTFEGSIYEQDKIAIKNIESAISKSMVQEKTLYRSIDAGVLFGDISITDFENLRNAYLYGAETPQEKKIVERVEGMIGKQVQENGFMSTSRDRDTVFDWNGFTGSDKDIPMQLNIPKNVHGADLSFLDVEGDEQKEVLLERGLYYEFVGFDVQRDQYGSKKLVALVNIIKKSR